MKFFTAFLIGVGAGYFFGMTNADLQCQVRFQRVNARIEATVQYAKYLEKMTFRDYGTRAKVWPGKAMGGEK